MKNKFTLTEIKKMPFSLLNAAINKAKKAIKKDETMQRICKEYNVSIDEIDYIPTYFKKLDVSATTDHGVVYLNYSLMLDGFSKENWSYLIHEYSHFFQQTAKDKPTKGSDDGEYLKNPNEQEGFANQIEFLANHFGDDHAEDYVDDLLDHHDENDNKKLKDKLMENID
jgi:hypothetical protein